jgi:hypothetical protein
MSFRPLNCRCFGGGLLVIWLALAGVVQADEGTSSAGRAIEISDPRSNTLITNVNQLGLGTYTEPDLEVDFLTPQALTQPRTSLSGTLALPPPSRGFVVPGKRAKELQDQRRNWAFTSPDNVLRDMALKEILNLPDNGVEGEDTRSASPVGRYYERMLRGRAGTLRQEYDWLGSRRTVEEQNRQTRSEDAVSLLGGADQSDQSMRHLMNPEVDALSFSGGKPGGLLETFGLRADPVRNETDQESVRIRVAQETQLKRFQSLLDNTYEADPLGPTRPAAPANPWLSASPTTAPGLELHNPSAAVPGALGAAGAGFNIAPPLPPSAPLAPAASSLTPAPYPLLPQQVNSMLLRKPDFTAPRRAF